MAWKDSKPQTGSFESHFEENIVSVELQNARKGTSRYDLWCVQGCVYVWVLNTAEYASPMCVNVYSLCISTHMKE